MPSGITINPGFKNMTRADLDKVAAMDFGLDPTNYGNIDEITKALQEAYDAETGAGADLVEEQQAQAEAASGDVVPNNDAEVEALKAQLAELTKQLTRPADVTPTESAGAPSKVVKATKESPWLTNSRT